MQGTEVQNGCTKTQIFRKLIAAGINKGVVLPSSTLLYLYPTSLFLDLRHFETFDTPLRIF